MRAQLAALGCARYEIGVHDRETGRVRRATLTADEVLLQVTRLAALSARGQDITVRPAAGRASGLVVLDGVDAAGLRGLREEGHVPVVVTGMDGPGGTASTMAARTQVWLRLSLDEAAPDPAVMEAAARALQARLSLGRGVEQGRDPGAIPVGRLAGFVDHEGQGARGRDTKDGAGAGGAEMHGYGRPVTVHSVSDRPEQVTPAAARVLAEAAERVEAQQGLMTDGRGQGHAGVEAARWGGYLVGAVAVELGHEDAPTEAAAAHPQRRQHPAGRTTADDERDSRGGR